MDTIQIVVPTSGYSNEILRVSLASIEKTIVRLKGIEIIEVTVPSEPEISPP